VHERRKSEEAASQRGCFHDHDQDEDHDPDEEPGRKGGHNSQCHPQISGLQEITRMTLMEGAMILISDQSIPNRVKKEKERSHALLPILTDYDDCHDSLLLQVFP
jgi:hypothetical protein